MAQPPHKRARFHTINVQGSTSDTNLEGQSPVGNPSNPFMPMFESFRAELDGHHDRRERVIKASRDITANSKKIIFSLQRVRRYGTPLPSSTLKEVDPLQEKCASLLSSLIPELEGINAWRYQRQISPGIQEMMEALIFSHYLQYQCLLDVELAQAQLPTGIMLIDDDWMGGVMDSVGECMRWAITGMAMHGEIPVSIRGHESPRNISQDLRNLRTSLEALRVHGSSLEKDVSRKMEVMRTSVNKVENAAYSLIVRGKERPTGWVPDITDEQHSKPEQE